ncbi:hypothetical protein MMC12_001473 [Toensbergia leucococca]|nr:hypothetical protein [Toensbergia leucococca]
MLTVALPAAAESANMLNCLIIAIVGLSHLPFILAQTDIDYSETIWTSVVFTRHGDRTPLILPELTTLTALGAQQLLSAGKLFRSRYIDTPGGPLAQSLAINGLSTNELDNDQVSVMSTVDQFTSASAQAFMQGLYPPYSQASTLTNGSKIDYPVGGYQYPQIYTASALDQSSIWISGQVNCPAYDNSGTDYFSNPEFIETERLTEDFYESFEQDILLGEFSDATANYYAAYEIFDYLNYGYTHNQTIRDHLSFADLTQARILADQWEYAVNGNVSASGSFPGDRIRTIAGQTMAAEVLGSLIYNFETGGEQDKLNLFFGSFEPMVSFAALAQLPQANSDFYGLPDFGSSMVFEMFSIISNNSEVYPDTQDLSVRFLFRNGTNSSSDLTAYPLFGRSASEAVMSLEDFAQGMKSILLGSIGDWCNVCLSSAVFCPSYTNSTSSSGSVNETESSPAISYGIRPAVAGVIGAIVALAVVGLVLAAAMLVGGIRFYRSKAKRRSELGGFKGGEKLASDPDLTLGKSGFGATVVGKEHQRIGSWELGENSKASEANLSSLHKAESLRRPSFEADDHEAQHFSQPTAMDERI